MDYPIYYARYFVNKQNVRSFSNVLDMKLLKSNDDTKFIEHVFQDKHLVYYLTEEMKEILLELKSNVRFFSSQDFKNYFPIQDNKTNDWSAVSKAEVLRCCLIALNEVIPKTLFGNNHNIKIFRKSIKFILFSMKRQCFIPLKILANWNYEVHPWKRVPKNISLNFLEKITYWIYRYLLSAMISLNFYVTTCKIDNDENKLHFFWKKEWQRFFDKNISNMLFVKTIKKFSSQCLGKRLRKRYTNMEKNKIKLVHHNIPKLYLVLKPNNDFRPIVHYKKENNPTEKFKTKETLHFLKVLAGPPQERLENQFEALHKKWLKQEKPKLYFVKTDLSNAFGAIKKYTLLKVLSERCQMFQNNEMSTIIKQKFAYLQKRFISDFKNPLLVRTGSTVYEWVEGLVQGYKYSPALAEIYYAHMDKLYLSKHLQISENSLKVFTRVVDDYLYITDSLEDAQLFLLSISNYRNINYKKTVVNFHHDNITCHTVITFLGHTYNTINLQVGRASNIYSGQMCYKISFIPTISDLHKFIDSRINQSAIQISTNIFNLNYNDEETIWQHIFITLCLSANKFCTILALLIDEKEMPKYLDIYKKRITVNLCNAIVETILKTKPKNVNFVYCENHFRYVSYKALMLCAKHTLKCNILVSTINNELAKSNCIFGKWREHASRIKKDGSIHKNATKKVCKRQDLSKIIKTFDKLPNGFACFSSKNYFR